jgi:dihydroceramidase
MKYCIVLIACYLYIYLDNVSSSVSHINPTVKYFEGKLDNAVGYWSPSDSTIDWCERNYVVTPYIAEFWNCISSLVMCFSAYLLLRRSHHNNLEQRFIMFYLSIGLVGLGSALFHGTVRLIGQMADELPMIYTGSIWHFLLLKINQPKYRDYHQKEAIRHGFDYWKYIAIFYVLLWTIIHSMQAFVLFFQAQFVVIIVGGIFQLIRLQLQPRYNIPTIRNLIIAYIVLLAGAMICWLLDQRFCNTLNNLPYNLPNPQFHAFWHVLCGISCHVGIVCSEVMRKVRLEQHKHELKQAEALEKGEKQQQFHAQKHVQLDYEYYLLPFLKYPNNTIKKIE